MVRLVSRMDRGSCPAQHELVRSAAPQSLLSRRKSLGRTRRDATWPMSALLATPSRRPR